MPRINPQGNPNAQVWIVTETPYPQDEKKGFMWSGGFGHVYEKMLRSAGIKDYYIIARACDTDDKFCMAIIENEINYYQPPIILAIEATGKHFCGQLIKNEFSTRKLRLGESEISKYAGSLLTSSLLTYPHYIIPSYGPDYIVKNWADRDIVISLDLGKARSELDYYESHNKTLQPLPERTLAYDIQNFEQLDGYLDTFECCELLANDIETIYPKGTKTEYKYHPGLHVSVSLAMSPYFGIAFELFRKTTKETRHLWRRLQRIFDRVPQLGQNFFNFDLPRWEMLGFRIDPYGVKDTLIRQHILYPELPKDLAFMTRQYTREPYYKDEGHGWSFRDLSKLKRYNCLDTTVDFEVYLGQEQAFNERPYLR
jgi:uracil-DNA glycosylase